MKIGKCLTPNVIGNGPSGFLVTAISDRLS